MLWGNGNWTNERRAIVKDLWAKGYSAGQIAKQLSEDIYVTRSAVIGYIHRNGFTQPANQWTRIAPPPPKPKPVPVVVAKPAPPPRKPAKVSAEFLNVPIMQLSDDQCRWPNDDNGPFLFCGQPVSETFGRPYCARHHRKGVAS
jgi:hypothetical protein